MKNGYRGPLVADIPLLFETGRTADFDAVGSWRAIRRASASDHGTRRSDGEADQRIAAQWPIAAKVREADYVVSTDGTFEDTDARSRPGQPLVDLKARRLLACARCRRSARRLPAMAGVARSRLAKAPLGGGLSVFFISMAIVSGPTPPGTGVSAPATSATSVDVADEHRAAR